MWATITNPILYAWRSLVNPTPVAGEVWILDEQGPVLVNKVFPPLHAFQGNDHAISFTPTTPATSPTEYWDLQYFRQQGYRLTRSAS